MEYLLKSTIILFVLYTFYKLFLEKESMHKFKRFYLLLSIFMAFVIPFLTYTQYVESIPFIQENTDQIRIESNTLNLNSNIPKYQYYLNILFSFLGVIYVLGVILFGLRFIKNILGIYYKIKRNSILKSNQYSHVLLYDQIVPHTFLNYLFFNKQKYKANLIPKEVILHEETHAQQKHTFDILFIEILQILLWFHPLFYFIKESIKLNHEFLADQAVLNQDIELRTYQRTLLLFSSDSQQPQLTTAINYSLIKKRFTVMKTQTPKRSIWLRSIVIAPLLAVLIYGFSEKVIVEKENQTKETTTVKINPQEAIKVNQTIVNKSFDLNIKINSKNQILINNEKLVTSKIFGREIKKIVASYNPEQLANTIAIIEAPRDTELGFITDVTEELRKAGIVFTRKYLDENSTLPAQDSQQNNEKASKEQIIEYNKIAKKYNDMPQGKMDIINKDVKRLMYLYRIMSVKQRKNAEPLPVFPPPPPAPNSLRVERIPPPHSTPNSPPLIERIERIPPPPPLPENASQEQKEKYKNVVKRYKSQAPALVYEYKTENGELIELVEVPEIYEVAELVELAESPLPPIPPISGLDHVIEMAKKGVQFYFEGKNISSEEAINLLKNNDEINVSTTKVNSKKPIVKLSVHPIIPDN